ncbi:MAG: hypothetical protein U0M61_07985, partial [Succinivibrio sp.]|nr:hypothetical protein [Succinivibrio sp.]
SVFMNILPNKSATLRNLKNGISKSIIKEFCSNQWKCGDFSPPVFNFICSNVHKCIAPINRDSAPMEQKIHLDVFKSCRIWIKHDTKGDINTVFKEQLYLGKKYNNSKVKTSMVQNPSLNKG